MPKRYDIVHVHVDDLRRGDVLAMSGEEDPHPQVFYVAKVEFVDEVSTGAEPRFILTSEPVGNRPEPMILEYPPGTTIRKVIGIRRGELGGLG